MPSPGSSCRTPTSALISPTTATPNREPWSRFGLAGTLPTRHGALKMLEYHKLPCCVIKQLYNLPIHNDVICMIQAPVRQSISKMETWYRFQLGVDDVYMLSLHGYILLSHAGSSLRHLWVIPILPFDYTVGRSTLTEHVSDVTHQGVRDFMSSKVSTFLMPPRKDDFGSRTNPSN
jgi:hypothetical protein